jgi:DNA-binding IclR family transcriptional regulator
VTVPTVHDGGAGSSEAGRSVLGRALAVLDTFSNERPEQTLGAICDATGLPSATTHRLVNELVTWGALERVGRGRYRIGLRLWQLGSLAPGPDDVVAQVLACPLPRLARNTITDPDVLRDTLTVVRESGYCISREEMTDGASSVAAPVRGPNGDVVAAISVVVPADRPDLTSLVPAVRVAAAGISRGLRPRRRST